MPTEKVSKSEKDKFDPIRKGLLEYVVLNVISARKVYAADILAAIAETEFATQEGTLYPLLSRMRREGTVDYEWVESDAGPPRKYYHLTAKGREQLAAQSDYWDELQETIKNLGRKNK
ncbi:MAG TPA: PadR family transcriptional regulator [Candidatus Paceibacterota bacterium]|nr:PadR family transcriptional regulator [Candidatus Paceibacterota bacterium]